MNTRSHPLLRTRDGHEARVTNVELFFDLIYAFAITQLSHYLIHDLSLVGALQVLLLWFAVWLGWQYTCWVTNWFDPDTLPIRLMLLGVMGLGLLMSTAIPGAFAEQGLLFAGSYVLLQVGRTLFVLHRLGRWHALTPNFTRMLGWLVISAVFWIAGGLSEGVPRMAFWAVAVICEYVSPMFGFPLPGLGRSRSSDDWTIEGGHLAERCQLFVIVALGESILATGGSFAEAEHRTGMTALAFLIGFIGSLAMWWMYFDTTSQDGSKVIAHAKDPGRIGAYFHYVHVVLIAGIIVCAVADDLVIAHPDGALKAKYLAVLAGGPALYLFGNALYKRIVYGAFPLSHWLGMGALAVLALFAGRLEVLAVGALTTAILVLVAAWSARFRRVSGWRPPAAHA